MKIVFIEPLFFYPPNVGPRIRAFNLIKGLSEDHQVTVLCFIKPTEYRFIEEAKDYCYQLETVPINTNYSYFKSFLHILSSTPQQVFWAHSYLMHKKLAKIIEEQKPDVIYTYGLRMAQYASNITYPKVLDLCDSFTLHYERLLQYRRDLLSIMYRLEKLKVKNYEKEILAQFDRALLASPVDKEYLENLSNTHNIEVIPNGCDLSYFNPSLNKKTIKKEPYRLIFMGDMAFFPNSDSMLYFNSRILPLIRQKIPQVELYIVGSNPPKKIKKLSKDPKIKVTGYVEDLRPYLASSSIFIAPLRVATGFQNKVVEAMAMGLPVITTPQACGGIEAKVDEEILLADNAEGFAKQTIILLNNKNMQNQLAAKARQLVENSYTWPKAVQKLQTVFKKTIAKR